MEVYQKAGLSFKYRPRLKISELFYSIQGEGLHSGYPCTFVRLTGCALRCTYCDTAHAFYGGNWHNLEELNRYVAQQPTRLVQITGGEPLHQKTVWPWVDQLVDAGYQPLIETSGAVPIDGLNPGAHIVLDLKTPASGEADRMIWENLERLKPEDEIKFVVCSSEDLHWSFAKIREHELDRRFSVLISPEARIQDKAAYADQVLASGLKLRFQIQLHKVLWGDRVGK